MSQQQIFPTEGYEDLMGNSYQIQQEAATGFAPGYQQHRPTDLNKVSAEETRELMGGYDGAKVCPKCRVTLAKNGECAGFC